MDRRDISELHYITPITNVPSILEHGILAHNRAARLRHRSVAMPEMQQRRQDKPIPGTNKRLHDYANLYFDAHNPMLSKLRQRNGEICILRIDPAVLDLPGVIITDRNAVSKYVRFYPVTEGLKAIDKEILFSQYWTHRQDQYEEWAHKSAKCAEVLVPDQVGPGYIRGAYLAHRQALELWRQSNIHLTAEIKADIFF